MNHHHSLIVLERGYQPARRFSGELRESTGIDLRLHHAAMRPGADAANHLEDHLPPITFIAKIVAD